MLVDTDNIDAEGNESIWYMGKVFMKFTISLSEKMVHVLFSHCHFNITCTGGV